MFGFEIEDVAGEVIQSKEGFDSLDDALWEAQEAYWNDDNAVRLVVHDAQYNILKEEQCN